MKGRLYETIKAMSLMPSLKKEGIVKCSLMMPGLKSQGGPTVVLFPPSCLSSGSDILLYEGTQRTCSSDPPEAK